jgi:A/G-specific adenine glycosylase
MSAQQVNELLTAVDRWYRRHARELPWRIGPGSKQRPDPYLVWLSEVMLQQTTIPHAAPYFLRFRERWPSVDKLARASWEEVSAAWAGLGYYSRARSLHACAKAVAEAGGFPQDRAGLIGLPGVGPYTAAAIASIAFGEKAAPVDGNIERVLSRVYAIGSDGTEAGWRASKKIIAVQAQDLFDALPKKQSPGDLAQALMDLGATICTPKRPVCGSCPLFDFCAARKAGTQERYPVKPEKRAQPVRHGSAFVAVRGDEVMLLRRPPKGLLGGMWMPPTSDWSEKKPKDALAEAPAGLKWRHAGEVRHVFTHFALKLDVFRADAPKRFAGEGVWVGREEALASLPTVGKKAVKLALNPEIAAR